MSRRRRTRRSAARPSVDAGPGGVVVLTNVLALSGNPYMRLWLDAAQRAGARVHPLIGSTVLARRDRPGWVHLQWPERVMGPRSGARAALRATRLLVLVAAARVRGARVLLTAHNTWSHDSRHPRLERLLYRSLGLVTTDVHLMSRAGAPEFFAHHPWFRRARRHYIPHGNYAPVVDGAPSPDEARRRFGFDGDERVWLTFGALKSYKGTGELMDAFRALDDEQARLVVAGRVLDAQLAAQIDRTLEADARVRVIGGFLGDGDLAALIRAADHVVLPYRRVLNSGSALLALTLGRPVVLPRTATFEALRDRLGTHWVTLFEDRLRASDLAALRVPTDPEPDLSWCDWDRIAEQLSGLWAGSVQGPPP
jgi:beta-1,4-mannosyltransferase